jgi:N-acetylglucosamine kinase-like BadF-type ATPase
VAAAVAGAQEWPQQARELADRLAAIEGCGMALVASDLIAAHADACAAQPGTVLIAGTGAVAMGMHANGTTHVVDGLGPELGDRGSGYWIGRRGVREALRGKDLDLPATRPLLSRMLARFGGAPVLWPARTPPMTGNSYAILAAFAVDVIELAGEGDECASRIVSTAAGHLADTAIRAANLADSDHVVGYGGLLSRGNTSMRDAVEAGLHGNGLRFSATAGDGISAAASLIKSHPGYQGSVHIATAQDPTHQ